jgi:putative AlgH/UPF0301 family transcriptional regulator
VISYSVHDSSDGSGPHEELVRGAYNDLLSLYLGGVDKSMLSPENAASLRVQDLVMQQFREASGGEASGESNASNSRRTTDVRLDVAFAALRELSMKQKWHDRFSSLSKAPLSSSASLSLSASLPKASPSTPSSNNSNSNVVKSGTFLLSHPLLSDYFSRTVIFVSDHSSQTGITTGYIVNRPSQLLPFVTSLPQSLSEAFCKTSMKIGGPRKIIEYGETSLQMLYRATTASNTAKKSNNGTRFDERDAARDSLNLGGDEVMRCTTSGATVGTNVFVGGDATLALEAVCDGVAKREDFAFATNVSVWCKGQLESEISRGFWIPCEADTVVADSTVADIVFNADQDNNLWDAMMNDIGCGEFGRIEENVKNVKEDKGWLRSDGAEDDEDGDAFNAPSELI